MLKGFLIFISYNGEVKCCFAHGTNHSKGVLILFSENHQTDIRYVLGDSEVIKWNTCNLCCLANPYTKWKWLTHPSALFAKFQCSEEYFTIITLSHNKLRMHFFKKIEDWILKSEWIWKRIFHCFIRQINLRSLRSRCINGKKESSSYLYIVVVYLISSTTDLFFCIARNKWSVVSLASSNHIVVESIQN